MDILQGSSDHSDARTAIGEATAHWAADISPDILFVFHSSRQDSQAVATILAESFPNTLIVGCSTAGEWITGQHKNGALVLSGIKTAAIRWSMAVIEDIQASPDVCAQHACAELLQRLDLVRGDLNPKKHFCLSFFDAISAREEPVIAAMAHELGGIPLLGGSAGDDLKFKHTFVIANGQAYQNAALFVLAESKIPFHTIKHQHFIPGAIDVVISKADVNRRMVYHLDGMPAAQRYAQLLGLDMQDLTPQVFSDNPLIYLYGDECYVRSIRQICDGDGLEFSCAIEEGMVLNLCEHQNMVSEYDKLITEFNQHIGKAEFLLICNCTYRALEGSDTDVNQLLADKTTAIAKHMIGFDTYGEQWQGLHVNQTMVALALGSE